MEGRKRTATQMLVQRFPLLGIGLEHHKEGTDHHLHNAPRLTGMSAHAHGMNPAVSVMRRMLHAPIAVHNMSADERRAYRNY